MQIQLRKVDSDISQLTTHIQSLQENVNSLRFRLSHELNRREAVLERIDFKTKQLAELRQALSEMKISRDQREAKLHSKRSIIQAIEVEVKGRRDNICEMKEKMNAFFLRKQNTYCLYQKFLRNKVQELKGNIRVFCRVRPVIPKMDDENDIVCKKGIEEVIKIHNFHKIEVSTNFLGTKEISQKVVNNSLQKQSFTFDAVFDEKATQEDLFREVYHLVISALDGYKVCIFAYGQTGSGKTHTMEGDYENPRERGIIPRAVEALFTNIEKLKTQGWEFEIETSFQEIY